MDVCEELVSPIAGIVDRSDLSQLYRDNRNPMDPLCTVNHLLSQVIIDYKNRIFVSNIEPTRHRYNSAHDVCHSTCHVCCAC